MLTIDSNINDSIRTIYNIEGGKLRFLETTRTMLTVANQDTYQIPNGLRKIIDVYISTNTGNPLTSTIYVPEMVFDPTKWKLVLAMRLGTSDWPYFTYVEAQTFKIQPVPASAGNTITIRGRINTSDLSQPDYTTGTIASVANAGVAVVGGGTSWTSAMAGRYLQITQTTAANGGDGMWYQIASVTDGTHLTLVKPYEGTAIVTSAAAYTIGQCSYVPEAYDIAIVYRSAALYWQNQNDLVRSKTYWTLYDGGNEAGYSNSYGGIISQMLATEGETEEGAYVPPFAGDRGQWPFAPYYLPYQDASGF